MSRAAREKKLKKVWRYYLTTGHRWTRQTVARKHGVRVEDVQRLIDESGPSKIQVVERGGMGNCGCRGCHKRRHFEGQLRPVRRI